MCIVFIYHTNDSDCKYKLILAANRDEYFTRPTKPADYHPESSDVLCGLDLEHGVEGGTWLGVSKSGKFSALTNVLVSHEQDAERLPRGRLVVDYLSSKNDTDSLGYLRTVQSKKHREFNLLAGNIDLDGQVKAGFYSNCDGDSPRVLEHGTNVIACTNINGNWNKVKHGRCKFDDIVSNASNTEPNVLTDHLLQSLLSDTTCLYPDADVKNQCEAKLEDYMLEKYCSVMITDLPTYGTRMQTVVLIDKDNHLYFTEKSLCGSDKWLKKSFDFPIELQL